MPQYPEFFINQPLQDILEYLLHQLLATLFWHLSAEHTHNLYHHLGNIIFVWNIGLRAHIQQDCVICYRLLLWIQSIERRLTALPDVA